MAPEISEELLEKASQYLDRYDEEGNQKAAEILKDYESSENPEVQRKLGVLANRAGDYASALRYFTVAAERGNSKAQAAVGECYLFGMDGTLEIDYDKAFYWIEAAEKQGESRALRLLGEAYYYALGVPKDVGKAFGYFEAAANSEEEWVRGAANYYLGAIYLMEEDFRDPERGKACLMKAVDQEETALFVLGQYYQGNFGDFETDYEEALKWYRKAADRGVNEDALRGELTDLAILYLDRRDKEGEEKALEILKPYESCDDPKINQTLGVIAFRRKDTEKGVEYYRVAAKGGNSRAQEVLGTMFLYGDEVEADYDEALKWLEAAQKQGSGLANAVLGEAYYKGEIVPKDIELAIEYSVAAADSENDGISTGAYYYLGKIYLEEEDYQDTDLGKTYLLVAAERGDADAALALGEYYEGFYGDVEPDLDQAMEWYKKAAKSDMEMAWKRIAKLYRRIEETAEMEEWRRSRGEVRIILAEAGLSEDDASCQDRVLVMGRQHFSRLVFKWGYRGRGGTNSSGYSCEKICEVDVEQLKGSKVQMMDAPELSGDTLGISCGISAIINDTVYLKGFGSVDLLSPYQVTRRFQIDTEWFFTITPYAGASPLMAIPQTLKELMREADREADVNDPEAVKRFLADLERKGEDVPEQYKDLVGVGKPELCVLLGEVYESGTYGIERDDKKAAENYRIAADQENCDAMARLGAIYHAGRGVERDDAEAVRWYEETLKLREITNRGVAAAWVALGELCYRGEGIGQDKERAFWLWTNAAEFDCPEERDKALSLLAEFCRTENFGVGMDYLEKKAEEGNLNYRKILGRG